MNGADLLCETLLANEIDVCFANPGTSEMHFVAALDRKPAMRCVLGLFEGVVTGAADGYARMADKPAATLLHLGPGLANGLANMHNARRAATPMVNIVGDHARRHLPFDAPLTTDIESLARPMSDWVGRIGSAEAVSRETAVAIGVARSAPGKVATLILPADAAWDAVRGQSIVLAEIPAAGDPEPGRIRAAAAALRTGRATVILLSGKALRDAPLALAGRIAGATGARLLAQQANGRISRGAGRVAVERVPYGIDEALAALSGVAQVILVGAKPPVGFFAYPGKPGSMLPEGCAVIEMTAPGDDLPRALAALAEEIALPASARPVVMARLPPPPPTGALTPGAIGRALANLMPEGAIVCDESISSGRDFFTDTAGAAPHDFLQLTGGAIGTGLPMAVGAAVACPERKVIALQADGSGMYTVQALWTQARERLDVLTIVYANRRYAILHGELARVGAGVAGHNARQMLDLDNPVLDWVGIAGGMGVEGVRVETAEAFFSALRGGLERRGPFLIEAVI